MRLIIIVLYCLLCFYPILGWSLMVISYHSTLHIDPLDIRSDMFLAYLAIPVFFISIFFYSFILILSTKDLPLKKYLKKLFFLLLLQFIFGASVFFYFQMEGEIIEINIDIPQNITCNKIIVKSRDNPEIVYIPKEKEKKIHIKCKGRYYAYKQDDDGKIFITFHFDKSIIKTDILESYDKSLDRWIFIKLKDKSNISLSFDNKKTWIQGN